MERITNKQINKDMNIINLTPHEVRPNNGKVYPSEGVARISNEFKSVPGLVCNGGENEPFVCFNENGTVELWMGMESKSFERVSELVRHLRENNIKMSCRSCMFIYEGMI